MIDERLTELELRIMVQERTIQELSDAAYMQQQTIDRLDRELKLLREQVTGILPSLTVSPADDEPPPHY